MARTIIVRFADLTTKKQNRSQFEQVLHEQVRELVRAALPDLQVDAEFGRMYVRTVPEQLAPMMCVRLSKLLGVHSVSSAEESELDMPSAAEAVLRLLQSRAGEPRSFKIHVKRVNKASGMDSLEIARHIGSIVRRQYPNWDIQMNEPEETIHVEWRERQAYLFLQSQTHSGAGGFPYGTNGRALALLSGGIDSPVAAWLAMRKGLALELLHFHSHPYTSEQAQQKVLELASRLARYSGSLTLHLVPLTPVQEYLRVVSQPRLLVTMIRRAMMRIAELWAARRHLQALITGDSLGQVASQTIGSLQALEEPVSIPVFRPLLMLDKQEIIERAIQIDTLAISQLPYEDCCTLFVPKHPSTNPNLNVIRETERRSKRLSVLIEEALAGTTTQRVTPYEPDSILAAHPLL